MGYMKRMFMDIQEYIQEHPEEVVGNTIHIEVDTFEGRKVVDHIITENDMGLINMDSLDQRDWQAKIPEERNTISCIECKKLFEEKDMRKIFARGEGICKDCWNFDDLEGR